MFKNRYFKSGYGRLNSFVGITGAVEYTAHADYATFVANSVSGEMGVFLDSKAATLVPGNAAAAAGTKCFIAVKLGDSVKKSPTITVGSTQAERTAYAAPSKGNTAITFNAAVTAAAKEVLALKVFDRAIGGHPTIDQTFQVTVKANETFDAAMTRLVAQINDKNAIHYQGQDPVVSATYVAGTNVLTITNLDFDTIITVVLQEDLYLKAVDSTVVTKTVMGVGHPTDAKLVLEHLSIRNGVTTNYPAEGTVPEDYGKPNIVIGDSDQYNFYTFRETRQANALIPQKVQFWPDEVLLLVRSNGAANPEAEVKAIFGL